MSYTIDDVIEKLDYEFSRYKYLLVGSVKNMNNSFVINYKTELSHPFVLDCFDVDPKLRVNDDFPLFYLPEAIADKITADIQRVSMELDGRYEANTPD